MRPGLGHEPRILPDGFETASASLASRLRPSRRSKNRCLYCPYGRHALPRARPRRRAAPASRRAAPAVAARRGRSRRPHRRGGRAPALCPRGLTLDVRLLHRGSPPLGGRGLPPHRRGARLAGAPGAAHDAGQRATAPHRRREAGPSPDAGEPGRLLERAVHRTKRQVEELVAELAPRPDAPALVRRLPERGPARGDTADSRDHGARTRAAASSCARALRRRRTPSRRSGVPRSELRPDAVEATRPWARPGRAVPSASIEPLAPGRYKVQFTASAELRDKLDRLRRSCAPRCPTATWRRSSTRPSPRSSSGSKPGDSAGRTPRKGPSAAETPPSSRHVPAAVRRTVYERDGGRCRYVDEQGRRCTAREGLEFHHRHPFALGGHHSPEGMALLCRTHNRLLAEIDFGREAVAKHRRSEAASRQPAVQAHRSLSP